MKTKKDKYLTCKKKTKEDVRLYHTDKALMTKLDKGIRREVSILRAGGIETFESCEGGVGHAFPEPTVRFYGEQGEGVRALGIALTNRLNVTKLRRRWNIQDGEIVGPWWELTFAPTKGVK